LRMLAVNFCIFPPPTHPPRQGLTSINH
jgi:hypothetical protein